MMIEHEDHQPGRPLSWAARLWLVIFLAVGAIGIAGAIWTATRWLLSWLA